MLLIDGKGVAHLKKNAIVIMMIKISIILGR